MSRIILAIEGAVGTSTIFHPELVGVRVILQDASSALRSPARKLTKLSTKSRTVGFALRSMLSVERPSQKVSVVPLTSIIEGEGAVTRRASRPGGMKSIVPSDTRG